jgi:UDPglucose 6-dehydrogenase
MRLAVIGSGYVGLVAGACFADSGNEVVCVDINRDKVASLQAGLIPIYEPGLEELIAKNVAEKRLSFTTELEVAVSGSDVVFIAVGTPQGESGEADLQYVLKAARNIGQAMTGYTVVVNKSTVPVGTADAVRHEISQCTQHPFDVVSNPEFLKEGAALDDFLRPDRVVIGADSDRARTIMSELYAPFLRTEKPLLLMDTRSAELTKYAANAMLASRISFMNDIATLCEKIGADVEWVRKGLGSDSRIGYPFLFPGLGYGGSCFPKDVKALVATAEQHGLSFQFLKAVEETNRRQKLSFVVKAQQHYGTLVDKTFAVWGLAFKPKTDDLREAPALTLINGLLAGGAQVRAFDPVAMPHARQVLDPRVTLVDHAYDALAEVDGLFVVTEWNEFRHPDFTKMKSLMKTPVIFDGRNIYSPAKLRAVGFTYFGIGRP